MSKTDKNKSLSERTSVVEWIAAGIGLALVLFSISYVAYRANTSKKLPPDLTVKVVSIKQVSNGYLVEFSVKNNGDQTAASVNIEGKIMDGNEEIETKSVTLGYVPAESENNGGLFFEKNPKENNLEIKASGYEEP